MTVLALVSYLAAHGCSMACQAGVIANLSAESGLRPCIVTRSGVAMPQWSGTRRTRFLAWAGRDWCNPRKQIEHVVRELGEMGIKNRLFAMTDPGDAAALFMRRFEMPRNKDPRHRMAVAWSIYNDLRAAR